MSEEKLVSPRLLEDKAAKKHDEQKEALKVLVQALFTDGARDGLRANLVTALRQALEVLGWLPMGEKR